MATAPDHGELCRLLDRVSEIADSPENERKRAHWARYHAGTPSGEDPEGPMVTMDIGIPTWARILGFDVRTHYADTVTQICDSLRMRIWQFENLGDDTVIGKSVALNPVGVVLEPSMLGVEVGFPPDMEPWALHDHAVIESEEELAQRGMPDFATSGYMPQTMAMYEEARDLLEGLGYDEWTVGFPGAIRGVLGLAQCLRGPHENVVMDMIDRPSFAHALFQYVTDFHCHYWTERNRYLGEPLGLGHIGNDEVTVPLVSPRIYREFLLPYEQQISAFHGGLTCWHSCGTTTPLLPLIRQIPNVLQFYTGPWTDVDAVVETFGADTRLMIAVNTVDDIMAATPEHMAERLRDLAARGAEAALHIRGGSMNTAFDLQADIEQMRTWNRAAKEALRN